MIELLAGAGGVTALAVFVFRSFRIHGFKARSAHHPRSTFVPLVTYVRAVYPGTSLHKRENKQSRRPGDHSPAWLPWLQQRRLSGLSLITGSGGGAEAGGSGEFPWTGAMALHALYRIDTHVFEAISHLISQRLEAFSDLRKPFQWVNPGLEGAVPHDRHHAERIFDDYLKSCGHDLAVSRDPRGKGDSLIVDGKPFVVRDLFKFDFQKHFEKYPGTAVITADDFFRPSDDLFTLDPSREIRGLGFLTSSSLDRIFDTDRALAQDAMGSQTHALNAASVGDAGFQNPFLTLGLSSLREIRLLAKKHTNLRTATRNIGLDVAGTGVGGYAGAKAGATIGTALAPGVGSVVGALIGGLSGAFAGRSITNRIKVAKAEAARSHYEEKMRHFQKRLDEVTSASRKALETTVSREQGTLSRLGTRWAKELENLTTHLESKSRQAYVLSPDELRSFFTRCDAGLDDKERELNALLRRLPAWDRIFWPGEEAVRLRVLRDHVRKEREELAGVRSALLGPSCSLIEEERTEVCLEIFAARGRHGEEIIKHLSRYRAIAGANVAELSRWPDKAIGELVKVRAVALRRIRDKANALRRKTEAQLESDLRSAVRAQNRFAKELRKLGLAA